MPFLIALAASLLVFTLVHLLATLVGRQRRRVLARLESLQGQGPDQLDSELEIPFAERVVLPGLKRAGSFFTRLTPRGLHDNIKHKLILAGSPRGLGPSEFLGLAGLTGAVGLGLGLLLAGLLGRVLIPLSLLGLAAGLSLPYLYLHQTLLKRRLEVQRSLPDVMDLLTISVEAGLGFDGAMVRVVEKLGGVLGEEFSRVLQEIKMGKARREALRDMAHRVGVEDLSSFISAVVQAEQLGVGIGTVLRLQSHGMRQKRRQRAEEAAMQAPIKMLFPLVFFIFPSLFVVLLGPALIQIMEALLS